MPTTIADNRKYIAMTADEADALMGEIARAEIDLARHTAEAESKIADIKSALEEVAAPLEAIIKQNAAALDRYIAAHPERFVKPRARKTDWGSYGLRVVSGLEVADEGAVIKYAVARRVDRLLEVKIKLNRAEAAKMVAEGAELPGCRMVSGERSFYKTAKALLDQAKQLPGMEG